MVITTVLGENEIGCRGTGTINGTVTAGSGGSDVWQAGATETKDSILLLGTN